MRTMKVLAASLAALTLGIAGGAGAVTGDQDIPRQNDPRGAPNFPPGTLVYPTKPGETPAAPARNTRNRGVVTNPDGSGYYYERPQTAPAYDARREAERRYEEDRRNGYNRGYGYDRGYGNNDGRYGSPGEYRQWHRGEYLPPAYRSRSYVVDDWRGHHLRRPPSGYHWVQSGGDYLLVAIATGIIASVILNQ